MGWKRDAIFWKYLKKRGSDQILIYALINLWCITTLYFRLLPAPTFSLFALLVLCLYSFPSSLRFLSHSPLMLLPLPLKVLQNSLLSLSLSLSLFVSTFNACIYMTNWIFMWGTDGNSESSKSVKLREDWRKRSRPIPPGGTYPAKDHCRLIQIWYIFSSFCFDKWLMVPKA